MQSENSIAFKEWGVVCAALDFGWQVLILRKGGIHEGRDGFRVQHREFWLFPTGFHQQPDEVIPEAWPWLKPASHEPPDRVLLSLYAVVQEVHHVLDERVLARLKGRHIWSDKTVEQRFQYRSPGLFALVVRVYRQPSPSEVVVTPDMAGCKSWVELPAPLATSGLSPVLDDANFESQRLSVAAALKTEGAHES